MTCTETELASKHNARLNNCSNEEELIEYIMDSLEYINNNDLQGYNRKFSPTPQKSQGGILASDFNLNCACGGYLVVSSGEETCIECGVIVPGSNLGNDENHMAYDRMRGPRIRIHRYKRIVHFYEFIRFLQGHVVCRIDDADLKRVRDHLADTEITPWTVQYSLLKCGLQRYRKHRHYLAKVLSGGEWQPVDISPDVLFQLMKLFKQINELWSRQHKDIAGTRKVFLSYPFTYYQLCRKIGREDLTHGVRLLKSKKLLDKQHEYWNRLETYITEWYI